MGGLLDGLLTKIYYRIGFMGKMELNGDFVVNGTVYANGPVFV